MDLPYAFEIDGCATALPIALWCSEFTAGVLGENKEPSTPCRIGFVPVVGAYVVCIEEQALAVAASDPGKALRYGRTNDFGWVLMRTPDSVGAPDDVPRSGWRKKELPPGGLRGPAAGIPQSERADADELADAMDAGVPRPRELTMFGPDDAVLFDLDMSEADSELIYVIPNQRYFLFWSYDQQLFENFVTEVQLDPRGALAKYEVGLHAAQPFLPHSSVAHLNAISDEERGGVARLLSKSDGEGYHAGWPVFDGCAAAIFDVTPAPLRALYLCEWLQWTCERMVHDDPHWPFLLALRSTIRAAEQGAPIPDLAKRMPSGIRGKRAGQLRAYLHALASARMTDRGHVGALVDVWGESKLHGHWREVADAMQQRYSILHPAQVQPPRSLQYPGQVEAEPWERGGPHGPDLRESRFSTDEREALVAYFDMYALGFRRAADAKALDAHLQHVERAIGWLQNQQKALLDSFDVVAFMRVLGLHVREGRAKAALRDRYHYACARHRIEFWKQAELSLPDQAAWNAYVPFAKWLTENPGLWTDAFSGLLTRYVPSYPQLTAELLEDLVRYLFRYHLALRGRSIETALPTCAAVVRIEPDVRAGRVRATLTKGADKTVLAELELLTALETMPDEEVHAPVGAVDGDTRFKRYRRTMGRGEVRTFAARGQAVQVLAQESAELQGFPKVLSDAADVLSAGLSASLLLAKVAKEKTWSLDAGLYLDFAQDTLQSFAPGIALVRPALERIGAARSAAALGRFVKGAEQLGRLGGGLEGIRNVVAGFNTLATFFSPQEADTDLAYYLDRGDGLPALLETAKGVAQLVSGSATTWTLLGVGTVPAAVPVAACVSVGLVAVATLDVLIYVSTDGGSPVKAFEDSVRQARPVQFKLDGDRIMMPDEQLPSIAGEPRGKVTAGCLLAKQLGTVHGVVQTRRA